QKQHQAAFAHGAILSVPPTPRGRRPQDHRAAAPAQTMADRSAGNSRRTLLDGTGTLAGRNARKALGPAIDARWSSHTSCNESAWETRPSPLVRPEFGLTSIHHTEMMQATALRNVCIALY